MSDLSQDFPKITTDEHKERVHKLQDVMAGAELDAIVLTSEDNYRYIAGFHGPTWINLTRPRYCIVGRKGDPVIIIPANNSAIAERTSWVSDVRTWVAPCPEDDGISLLIDAIRQCLGRSNRIGMELGAESRLTMPVGDFLRLKDALDPVEIVDGFRLLHSLRMVKSPAETATIRRIAQIGSQAFDELATQVRPGDTEKVAGAKLRLDLIKGGADTTPYVSGGSGRNGYTSINLGLADQVLEEGDILTIDTGSTVDGYFCDFNRGWSFGQPSHEVRRAYERVWQATEVGLQAVRPGIPISDVWRAIAHSLSEDDDGQGLRLGQGRFGHGVGLRMCEPPSLNERDDTILKVGMVITLEPGMAFIVKSNGEDAQKIMVHEENVVVTEDGCELLTSRAPRELPVVS